MTARKKTDETQMNFDFDGESPRAKKSVKKMAKKATKASKKASKKKIHDK